MDMDRFDAETYASSEFDEVDYYAYEQNDIAPLLDNDDETDEHTADFGMYSIDVSEIVEEIWLDSAPPMHFSIEAGYF
jgi:hypothetical protein